ncbi:MAG TPA: HXXEE domain-containing protein [Microbacteriaceae bacterium]|nr:HXXEE domain-containing protein [Microbacteriaceae bacterium]
MIETYGRWPRVAAAALCPAWAAALANRRRLARDGGWVAGLALPILLAHQTEEWVRPGGFLPFANKRLLGSRRPDWPLTRRVGFHVNVTAGWGSAVAGMLLWKRSPGVAAGVVAMEAGNVAMHAGMAVRQRRYNPGLATAVVLMAPHAVASARWLARSGRMSRGGTAMAALIGAAFAALPVSMKLRMRDGRHLRPPSPATASEI